MDSAYITCKTGYQSSIQRTRGARSSRVGISAFGSSKGDGFSSLYPEPRNAESAQSRAHGHGIRSQEAQTWEKGAGACHVMGQAPSRRCHISRPIQLGQVAARRRFGDRHFERQGTSHPLRQKSPKCEIPISAFEAKPMVLAPGHIKRAW
jgi:hypothetical protein